MRHGDWVVGVDGESAQLIAALRGYHGCVSVAVEGSKLAGFARLSCRTRHWIRIAHWLENRPAIKI